MGRQVELSKELKLFFGIVFLMLAVVLGIEIGIVIVGVNTKQEMESDFSKSAIIEMLSDTIALIDLQSIITNSVTDPAVILAIQQALIASLAGYRSVQDVRRTPAPTCVGITDEPLCTKTYSMCDQLHICMWTQNITQCLDFGYKALSVCESQNF